MVVAQTLQMQPESTKELGDVVYAESGGNALFVQQLINTLKQEGQLVYSANDHTWTWDIKALQSRDSITDNCVSLMKRKILGLGNELQSFLKKAACLPDYITFLAASDDSISNALLLESAIREGLISKTPDGFKFTHSLFQSVIYNSIPETERKALHLGIGRDLWSHSSVEELEASIYVVVDQLRRCADLMTDPGERAEYAKLCLLAGERASGISAFPSSCEYFLQGMSMLSEGDWKNQNYDLNLRLHTAYAEAQNMIGKSERRRTDVCSQLRFLSSRLIA
jgi:predicted ATPase